MTRNSLYAFMASLIVLSFGCATGSGTVTGKVVDKEIAIQSNPDATSDTPEARVDTGPVKKTEPEVVAASFGRGIAKGNGMTVTFMHNVTRYENGSADGVFAQSALGPAGTLDLEVDVTCASLDSVQGKGWIGGKVKRNNSTNPIYASSIGAEAWFRILDLGREMQTALISLATFRDREIKSAIDFCEKKPWSDSDLLELDQGALAIFP
ncbi:MAG: hypothetical protein OER80_10780 [Gammaproteobacteria bacterium]|nr:hypothetical protein [Gammaproteobacteria bacterium]MDH3768024.1 hypothetical protein [Gammaproteobacteria bacterium]